MAEVPLQTRPAEERTPLRGLREDSKFGAAAGSLAFAGALILLFTGTAGAAIALQGQEDAQRQQVAAEVTQQLGQPVQDARLGSLRLKEPGQRTIHLAGRRAVMGFAPAGTQDVRPVDIVALGAMDGGQLREGAQLCRVSGQDLVSAIREVGSGANMSDVVLTCKDGKWGVKAQEMEDDVSMRWTGKAWAFDDESVGTGVWRTAGPAFDR